MCVYYIYIYTHICSFLLFSVVYRTTHWLLTLSNQLLPSQAALKWDEECQAGPGIMDSAIKHISIWNTKFCNTLLTLFSYWNCRCKLTFYFTALHVSIVIFLCSGNLNFSASVFPFLQFMQIQLSYKCHHRLIHASCQHCPWLWYLESSGKQVLPYQRMFGRKECFN